MKKTTLVLASVLTAFTLATGCSDDPKPEEEPAAVEEQENVDVQEEEATKETNNEATEEEAAQAESYTSTEGAFTLQLPEAWTGHFEATEMAEAEASEINPGAKFLVHFDFIPAEQPENKAGVLEISGFTSEDWAALSQEEPALGEVIMETEEMVYVVATATANPFEEGSAEAEQYEAMMMSLEDVQAAFSIAE